MEAASHVAVPEASISKPLISVNPWIILAVLMVGEYMIMLDTTIVNVAIPSLITSLGASFDEVLWVLNGYILIFAVLLITTGRLGDIVGPKKLYVAGMALFTVASLACGLAQNPGQLIAFRVVQALGAATLAPQPGTIITSIFTPEQRGKAFGILGATIGLSAITGPTLGGVLTSGFSWRAVFIPNVPLGLIALLLAFLTMPEIRIQGKRRLDIPGVALATAGLFAGVYAMIEGQRYNWGRINNLASFDVGSIHASLISIPTLIVAGVLLLVIFILWEARQEEPLLPLSLFRDRNFSLGNIVLLALTFMVLGVMMTLLLFLQSVRGLTPLEAGVAIVPQAVVVVLCAPLAGALTSRINAKYLPLAGMLSYTIGILLMIRAASLTATGLTFTVPLLFTGLGMGLIVAPIATVAMNDIAPSAAGAASGFMNTIRQLGTCLGSAIIGAVFQSQLATEMKSQAVHYSAQLPATTRAGFVNGFATASSGGLEIGRGQNGGVKPPPGVAPDLAHQFQLLGQLVFQHAFLNAWITSLRVPIAVTAVGFITSLFLRSIRPAPEVAVAAAEEVVAGAAVSAPVAAAIALGSSADTMVLPVLRATQVIRTRAPSALRPPYLRLAGADQTEHPVNGAVSIGRMPDNDITVQDLKVSRRHAEVFLRDGRAVVRDLNSGNGTFVNGQRVSGEMPLRNGDTITMGDTSLVYHNDYDRARPRLVGTSNGDQREYGVDGVLTIGRSDRNDIVVRDPKASRRHAEITVENGQIVVRDLESLNGTKVNGELIAGEYPLREGDVVAVGDTPFVYHVDVATAGSSG